MGCAPVRDYLVFYRLVDDFVEVVRVLHGARDIEALLEEEE
jgi:toxin ParE1/3/4